MARRLSLLKPFLHTTMIKYSLSESNFYFEPQEKATYLNIPTSVDLKTLKQDIKKGAEQFAELDKLIEKENEPQYILLSVNNLEQGYLAVTYLAAGFNRKHGVEIDCEWDDKIDQAESLLECWEENELQIPIISENELTHKIGGDAFSMSSFSIGDIFMQGNQKQNSNNPYWMECIHNSVCIVSARNYMGFGVDSNAIQNGLNYFRNNDKVYIICLNEEQSYRYEYYDEEDIDNIGEDRVRAKWNSIVLSLAADEASVILDEKKLENIINYFFKEYFM